MTYGPVEMIVLQTPEPLPNPAVISALRDLVDREDIRIIDLAFIHADRSGDVTATELADLDPARYAAFAPLVSEISGLISAEDLAELGEALSRPGSADVLLIEHRWPHRLNTAARRAGGKMMLHLRVPRETIAEVAAARRVGVG
jgi:hypothetical protein